jgi:hypothetical protein
MTQCAALEKSNWLAAIEFGAAGSGLGVLQAAILPAYIEKRRWYASKDKGRRQRTPRRPHLPRGTYSDWSFA